MKQIYTLNRKPKITRRNLNPNLNPKVKISKNRVKI